MIVFIFFRFLHFSRFLQVMRFFSTPTTIPITSTFFILRDSERVFYFARKYTLSGYVNVPTNLPTPAHPPTHPARPFPPPEPATHPLPGHATQPPPDPTLPATPPSTGLIWRFWPATPHQPSPPNPPLHPHLGPRLPAPSAPPRKKVGSCRTGLLMCGAEAARERREGCVQRRGGGVAAALRRRCGG